MLKSHVGSVVLLRVYIHTSYWAMSLRGNWLRQSQSQAWLWLTIIKSCVHTYCPCLATSKQFEPSLLWEKLNLMSTWRRRCPLKKTPESSQSFLGWKSCFLGGPAESQAPEGSGSVQCWTFFPSVKAKYYFYLPHSSTRFPLQLP